MTTKEHKVTKQSKVISFMFDTIDCSAFVSKLDTYGSKESTRTHQMQTEEGRKVTYRKPRR